MKTVDFSYYIERYNCGEMSISERAWFDKELEGNEKLRNEVILRKRTDNILKNQDVISLRNKLAHIEKSRASSTPVSKFNRKNALKYAAVITIIVLIGSFSIFRERNLTIDELLKPYDIPYQPATGQRSLQNRTNEDFNSGIEYFNISDYKNAALYFNKVIETNPRDMAATLMNGISDYEETRYSEAKVSLGKVVDDNKNLYMDQAQWYLAKCYIRTEENDKAVQVLRSIKTEGGFYSKPASKLLRKLE